MSKIIIRWCVGDVHEKGIKCLQSSIKFAKKIFKNFDVKFIVCYNNIKINKLNVDEIIDQNKFKYSLKILPPYRENFYKKVDFLDSRYIPALDPPFTAWKLYPPRLDLDCFEIFLDNDLILYELPLSFYELLEGKIDFIITPGLSKCYGKYLVKSDIYINTGFFILPPKYDFQKDLNENISGDWNHHFDEQGLIAKIFLDSNKKIKLLNKNDICICEGEYFIGKCGMHFVGLNNGFDYFYKKFFTINLH